MSFFDNIYRERTLPYGDAPDPVLAEHAGDAGGALALDAGGGTGRNALWLARHGYRVELIDASAPAVETARRTAASEGLSLETHVIDLREWQPQRQYALVVCAITLHVFKQRRAEAVAAALREAVAPGGRFFLSFHLAGGAEQHERDEAKQAQIEPRTYETQGHRKRLFTLEEARRLMGFPIEFELIASGERCPRAECPFVHDVFRAISRKEITP